MNQRDQMADSVMCRECQTDMEVLRIKRYPGRWPTVLILLGAFCCLFFVGAVIGLPMLLLGIYMATAKENVSYCPTCGHYFKVWLQGT